MKSHHQSHQYHQILMNQALTHQTPPHQSASLHQNAVSNPRTHVSPHHITLYQPYQLIPPSWVLLSLLLVCHTLMWVGSLLQLDSGILRFHRSYPGQIALFLVLQLVGSDLQLFILRARC